MPRAATIFMLPILLVTPFALFFSHPQAVSAAENYTCQSFSDNFDSGISGYSTMYGNNPISSGGKLRLLTNSTGADYSYSVVSKSSYTVKGNFEFTGELSNFTENFDTGEQGTAYIGLISYSSLNYVSVSWTKGDTGDDLLRLDDGSGSYEESIPNTTTSLKVKIVHSDAVVTTYYDIGSGYVEFNSTYMPLHGSAVHVENSFEDEGQSNSVDFDNLTLVCNGNGSAEYDGILPSSIDAPSVVLFDGNLDFSVTCTNDSAFTFHHIGLIAYGGLNEEFFPYYGPDDGYYDLSNTTLVPGQSKTWNISLAPQTDVDAPQGGDVFNISYYCFNEEYGNHTNGASISDEITVVMGYGSGPEPTAKNVYRFWSNSFGSHFYTMSATEKSKLINNDPNWKYESIAFKAYDKSNCPTTSKKVYRFYSSAFSSHFFTVSESEKSKLITSDPNWKYEGVAYCTADASNPSAKPLYRFWSDRFNSHFFTTSESEKNKLINTDKNWKFEGVAYMVL